MEISVIERELSLRKGICGDKIEFENVFYPVGFSSDKWVHGMKDCGVYLIGDFYVGQSIKLKSRLRQHFNNCMRGSFSDPHSKEGIIRFINNGLKIPVFLLSKSICDEFYWAGYLKNERGFPIMNKLSSCRGHVTSDQKLLDFYEDQLKKNGYTVKAPAKR